MNPWIKDAPTSPTRIRPKKQLRKQKNVSLHVRALFRNHPNNLKLQLFPTNTFHKSYKKHSKTIINKSFKQFHPPKKIFKKSISPQTKNLSKKLHLPNRKTPSTSLPNKKSRPWSFYKTPRIMAGQPTPP